MSAPSLAERDAEYLKYGFLSIKASNAIRAKLHGDSLTTEELKVLLHADELLRRISSGAVLASSGHIQANDVDPLASMKAFDFARDPIRHIQGHVKARQLADLFGSMANTIKMCSVSAGVPTKDQKEILSVAASFFDALYQHLAIALDRRTPTSFVTHPIGDRLPHQ